MGYLEASLSLNPSDREPKTTIVTRVMLGRLREGAGPRHGLSRKKGPSPTPPSQAGEGAKRPLDHAD